MVVELMFALQRTLRRGREWRGPIYCKSTGWFAYEAGVTWMPMRSCF